MSRPAIFVDPAAALFSIVVPLPNSMLQLSAVHPRSDIFGEHESVIGTWYSYRGRRRNVNLATVCHILFIR